MKTVIRWFWRSVLPVGIAAALGFGGYQAFATTAANYCEFDPPIMGPCATTPECQEMCTDYYYPEEYIGVCSQNCCVCIAG